MQGKGFIRQFKWRFLVVRILVNAIALAVTAAILPRIYFVDPSIGSWILMALMLGVLNALIKPLLQFLTLQFIFVTYGLVIVLVNALLLWLLALLFPGRFAAQGILWLLLGGLILGLLSSFLESLLGLTMPIVPEEPPSLRRQLKEQAHQVDWMTSRSGDGSPDKPALSTQSPVTGDISVEQPISEVEAVSLNPARVEVEPAVPEILRPAESTIQERPEPAPETQKDQEDDTS